MDLNENRGRIRPLFLFGTAEMERAYYDREGMSSIFEGGLYPGKGIILCTIISFNADP